MSYLTFSVHVADAQVSIRGVEHVAGDAAQQPEDHMLPLSGVGRRRIVARKGGISAKERRSHQAARPILHRAVWPADVEVRPLT